MVKYTSTIKFESKLVPGVSFHLRKISHARRIKLNELAAAVYAKMGDINRELAPVMDEIKRAEAAAVIEPCTCDHSADEHDNEHKYCTHTGCTCRHPKPNQEVGDYAKRLELESRLWVVMSNELYPIIIRWGVLKIEGLEIDGQPATTDLLIEEGPSSINSVDLVEEVGAEIQRMLSLSTDEVMGFAQPITSAGQADGQTTSTIAPAANDLGSTALVGAASTSPN